MHRLNFTCVLVPVDPGTRWTRALDYGAAIASAHEAELRVLHVEDATASPSGALAYATRIQRLRDLVNDLAARPARSSVAVADADPVNEILHDAQLAGADLVVVPAPSDADELEMLDRLASSLTCPLLVVPTGDTEGSTVTGSFPRVLCAVAMGSPSGTPIAHALSFAQDAQGHITIVHIVEPQAQSSVHLAIETIEGLIPREALAWCEVGAVVSTGHPAQELASLAGRVGANLIVLGAPRTARSPVRELLASPPCAVLVAHPVTPRAERLPSWIGTHESGPTVSALRDPVW